MTRARLDQELVARSLAVSRSGARSAIVDGLVRVDGRPVTKPATKVSAASVIELDAAAGRYVGRGARKLEAALDEFGISVMGRSAVDVGSSTGGFTEVLLDQGAVRVVAIDVGHDQLHGRLRADPRVEVREGTNIRHVDGKEIGAPFDVITVDLSFISLRVVAEVLTELGGADSDWVVLVKPQFEVGRAHLGKGGVVRSAEARDNALQLTAAMFAAVGLTTVGAMASPVIGGSGNREALLWLRTAGQQISVEKVFKVPPDA
jgi:23S rRNA (cytidine1920-2'-O)/16S rRNA (cytidine1409-2'-O)-methyltransferase